MSLTQSGNYIAFISFLLGLFKVNIATEEISQFVEATFIVVGLILSWYGRYRKGDLRLSGLRKKEEV